MPVHTAALILDPYPAGTVLQRSLGSLLVGIIIQALFFGVLCSMVLGYYMHYRGKKADSLWFRVFIFIAWALCAGCFVDSVNAIYSLAVKNFNNPLGIAEAPRSVCLLMTLGAAVSALVQFMFLERLWKFLYLKGKHFSWRTPFIALIVVLSLFDLAGSIAITVKIYREPSEREIMTVIKAIYEAVFAAGVGADVLLVTLLVTSLNEDRTGLKRTNSVINKLIVYTVHTGLFPTVVASAGMITFLTDSDDLLYISFQIQIPNLYLISLIASLESREVVRQRFEQPFTVDFSPLEHCVPTHAVPGMVYQSAPPDCEAGLPVKDPIQLDEKAFEVHTHEMLLHDPCTLVGGSSQSTSIATTPIEEVDREDINLVEKVGHVEC